MADAKKTTDAPVKTAEKASEKPAENPADALGAAQIQERFDEANGQGFWGDTPDPTPNENYTLAGVTAGKPTPENQRGK